MKCCIPTGNPRGTYNDESGWNMTHPGSTTHRTLEFPATATFNPSPPPSRKRARHRSGAATASETEPPNLHTDREHVMNKTNTRKKNKLGDGTAESWKNTYSFAKIRAIDGRFVVKQNFMFIIILKVRCVLATGRRFDFSNACLVRLVHHLVVCCHLRTMSCCCDCSLCCGQFLLAKKSVLIG